MHQEKNGNTLVEIQEVKFFKKYILVCIEGEEYKLSESTYSYFYIYKDKKISQDELQEILRYQDIVKYKDYVIKLLSNGLYTEKEIRNKLNKKKVSKKIIDTIICELKEKKYINDEKFLAEYFDIVDRKNYGKNKIKQEFIELGISQNDIGKLSFDDERELEKSLVIGNKYLIHHKTQSKNQLKQGLHQYLLRQGFENDIIQKASNKLVDSIEIDEISLLEKEMTKYILIHRLNINDVEDKKRVISYLLRKGYQYGDIIEVTGRM